MKTIVMNPRTDNAIALCVAAYYWLQHLFNAQVPLNVYMLTPFWTTVITWLQLGMQAAFTAACAIGSKHLIAFIMKMFKPKIKRND